MLTQNSLVNNSSISVKITILHLNKKTQWKNTKSFLSLSHADSLYVNTEKEFSTHQLNECVLYCMRNRMAAKYFRYSYHPQSFLGSWSLQASLWKDTVPQHSWECGCSGILLQLRLSAAPHPSLWEKPKQSQKLDFNRFCLSNLYTFQYQIEWLIVTSGQFI